MATNVTVTASVTLNDGTKDTNKESISNTFAALVKNGKRETVTLTNAVFTALTVPAGAKGIMIVCDQSLGPMTLKGVTGDTGIVILTATAPGVPIVLPLGTTPVIGILNSNAASQVVDIIWF